ncbi:MAG: ADP-ribosylation factor-like protein [Candidatus Sigynarchaeota archaeon]
MFKSIDETKSNDILPSKKIIFTGLDNGGKSSIILALQRTLANLATLAPTKMVDRMVFDYLGYKITNHDLGGQKKYLITYLKQPGKYFIDASVVIYVIDIQDTSRQEESLSYFKDVLAELVALQIKPLIFVLFHKAEKILLQGDPETEKELEGSGMQRVKQLEKTIMEINAGRFKIDFKITTIFDLWSIMSAFSDIMLSIFPQSVLLDKTLGEYASANQLDALLLLDSNSLHLGAYYRNKDSQDIVRSSTPYFLTLLDSWKPFKIGSQRKQMKVTLNEYTFYFKEIRQPIPSAKDKDAYISFYFLAMTTNSKFDVDRLEDFSKMILGILKM